MKQLCHQCPVYFEWKRFLPKIEQSLEFSQSQGYHGLSLGHNHRAKLKCMKHKGKACLFHWIRMQNETEASVGNDIFKAWLHIVKCSCKTREGLSKMWLCLSSLEPSGNSSPACFRGPVSSDGVVIFFLLAFPSEGGGEDSDLRSSLPAALGESSPSRLPWSLTHPARRRL